MPRVHTVQKARKDYPDDGISKGDTYYWWKFPYGSRIMSLIYPKRGQLTKSPYKSSAYDIDDNIQALEDPEELSSIADEIGGLRDEAQDALDNMPEHLQETSSSGETLQQYVDDLDGWYQELDAIDIEVDADLKDGELEDRLEEILTEIKEIGCPL